MSSCRIYMEMLHTRVLHTRVFFSFLPKERGHMRLYRLLGGKYVSVCKGCGKVRGFGGILSQEIFDFGPFITCNLVESGTVFAQTFTI